MLQANISTTDFKAPLNMTQCLVDEIGLAIVTGQYGKQGMIPSEKDLCKHYGVSRVVVREATKILGAKRMIYSRMSQGTWIHPESQWNLFDDDVLHWLSQRGFCIEFLTELRETRAAIEPSAASLAAQNADTKQLLMLSNSLENIQTVMQDGGDVLSEQTAFHILLLNASNNRFYRQFSSFIRLAVRYQFWAQASTTEADDIRLELYEQLIASLSKRDNVKASMNMREIIACGVKPC